MTGLFLVVLTATIVTLEAIAITPILISKCSCKVGV